MSTFILDASSRSSCFASPYDMANRAWPPIVFCLFFLAFSLSRSLTLCTNDVHGKSTREDEKTVRARWDQWEIRWERGKNKKRSEKKKKKVHRPIVRLGVNDRVTIYSPVHNKSNAIASWAQALFRFLSSEDGHAYSFIPSYVKSFTHSLFCLFCFVL